MYKKFGILGLMLALTAYTACAKVYKWTDEKGVVHYSDKPIDNKSQAIKINKGPSDALINEAKIKSSQLISSQRKMQNLRNEAAEDKRDAEEKQQKDQIKNENACIEANRLIRVYSGRGAVFRTDESDKKTYLGLTDEQKIKKLAELVKQIKDNCQ